MEIPAQAKITRSGSDRIRLWLLIGFVTLSGLVSGIPILNAGFFLLGLIALIVLTARYGHLFALIAVFLALAICSILYGPILAAGLLILILTPGLLMGHKARAFGAPYQILIWGIMPTILPLLFMIAFYPYLISQTPGLVEQMRQQFAASSGIFGLSGSELEQASNSIKSTVEVTIRLAPGIFFTMMAAIVVISYLGAASVGSRFGAMIPMPKPLSQWRASEYWLIPFGLSLFFVLLDGGALKIIGENALVFLVHVYAFYGICLAEFYLGQILVSGWLRLVLYVLAMVVGIIFIPVLAFMAIIDSRFDLRKIHLEKDSQV